MVNHPMPQRDSVPPRSSPRNSPRLRRGARRLRTGPGATRSEPAPGPKDTRYRGRRHPVESGYAEAPAKAEAREAQTGPGKRKDPRRNAHTTWADAHTRLRHDLSASFGGLDRPFHLILS